MAAKKTKPVAKGKAKSRPPSPAKRRTSRARARTESFTKKPPRVVFVESRRETARSRAERSVAALEERLREQVQQDDEEPPPAPPGPESEVAERVNHCWLLMAKGLWNFYASRAELGTLWGVTDSTMRNYAAEAGRRFRMDPDEAEAAKLEHVLSCRRIMRDALASISKVTELPDFMAALKADERIAKYRGIDSEKTKVELTGKDGGPIETKTPTIMIPPEVQE